MLTKALAIVVAVLIAALGWQWGRAERAGRQADQYQVERDAALQSLAKEHEARTEEVRRHAALQDALNAEYRARQEVEADLRRADAAAVGLRDRARQLAAAARCPARSAEAAASSPPAEAPGDLLADMLLRIDEAAGELGRHADQSRLAGQLCERAYDALTSEPSP